MTLRIIGPQPFVKNEQGRVVRIGTIFPGHKVLVTVPGIHATQRLHYLDVLDQERVQAGLGALTPEERSVLWSQAVSLSLDEFAIQIRPDPEQMALAFQADELLTEQYSTPQVRFQDVRNKQIYEAIKRRGASWRITPLPKTAAEMRQMIQNARIGIRGRPVYYYGDAAGTRFLTCQEFSELGKLPEQELRQHLREIQEHSALANDQGHPEISFFMAEGSFSRKEFVPYNFETLGAEQLRETHRWLADKFTSAVRPGYQRDDVYDDAWRNRMFGTLIGEREEVVSEEHLLGLGSEFYLQIEWLPGARFEHGELILDPIFQKPKPGQPRDALYDEKVPGFIFNLIREYGDLEYVNLGRVVHSLSRRRRPIGRRDVYLAALRPRNSQAEVVKIIRMQKFGVAERLNEGKDLLQAMLESEEYTDYVLGRRVGCRQLGMNITPRLTATKLMETYRGSQQRYYGRPIWSAYFERDYVGGVATDKIPQDRFQDPNFALRFARLLGAAAAPNLIVGRCDYSKHVVFDDGDEVVLDDESGLPLEILVVEQMGSFQDFQSPLRQFAPEYAGPVVRRLPYVSQPEVFAAAYLEAFGERFTQIQQEYKQSKKAFDSLFAHSPRDEAGSLAFRWERILQRLENIRPAELCAAIREAIQRT